MSYNIGDLIEYQSDIIVITNIFYDNPFSHGSYKDPRNNFSNDPYYSKEFAGWIFGTVINQKEDEPLEDERIIREDNWKYWTKLT